MANTKQKLLEDIECEGFYNALVHYDDYTDIPDEKFQELYRLFLQVDKELHEHLGLPPG